MAETFKKISITVIIIGLIGIAINLLFGNTIGFVQTQTNNYGMQYYTYNIMDYIENIRMSITDTTQLNLDLPTRQWQWATIDNWFDVIPNDLALMLDYIIMIQNVLLYPFRIGSYLLRVIMALIGINVINPNAQSNILWLINLVESLINLQIPYI